MFKFYSSCGVVALSRFEDGHDLPERFRGASTGARSSGTWTSEAWLADMLKELVEEENMCLDELLDHLSTMGI